MYISSVWEVLLKNQEKNLQNIFYFWTPIIVESNFMKELMMMKLESCVWMYSVSNQNI